MGGGFVPHEIEWTREKSSRLWNYFTSSGARDDWHFSRQAGGSVLDFVQRYISPKGNILDYGCGPGFLMQGLIKRGIPCEGVELAVCAAQAARARLSPYDKFGGVTVVEKMPTPFEDERFDVVFLIETLEHLLPDELIEILEDIRRILRKGGYIVATTPNGENLESSKVICPDCGCIFHRGQHLSSWTTTGLSSLMENVGFARVACEATKFGAKRGLRRSISHVLRKIRKRKCPHLIYIGRKSARK
jgi:SAM-dependent methyltransferase